MVVCAWLVMPVRTHVHVKVDSEVSSAKMMSMSVRSPMGGVEQRRRVQIDKEVLSVLRVRSHNCCLWAIPVMG